MDINMGIHLVVDYLELGGYHDHVLLLKGVNPLVSKSLVGSWSILFASQGVILIPIPWEIIWHWIEPQHLSGLSSIIFPYFENLWFIMSMLEVLLACEYESLSKNQVQFLGIHGD